MNPFYKKIVITSAIYLTIFFGIIFFILKPVVAKFQENKANIAEKRAEQTADLERIASLQKIEKNTDSFDEINKTIETYLPDNLNSGQFIVEIESLAKELNVQVNSLSMNESSNNVDKSSSSSKSSGSSSKKSKSTLYENSFTINAQAPYSNLLEFLGRMEHLSRVNTIDSLDFSPFTANSLNLKISGNIYYGQ